MRRIRTGLILSVGVAVASCGGSSTEPEDLLTGAEALALFEVAMSQGLQLTDELEPGSETLTPDGAVLQFTVPCTMGGTVGVTARLGPAGEPDVDGASVRRGRREGSDGQGCPGSGRIPDYRRPATT